MKESDSFTWIDSDEAVFWGCLLVGLAAWAYAVAEPKAKPRPITPRCAVTVAQYGPSERWSPKAAQPACAGALSPLPNHTMTMPLEKR